VLYAQDEVGQCGLPIFITQIHSSIDIMKLIQLIEKERKTPMENSSSMKIKMEVCIN
jgi:hypothetical protein